MRKSDVEAIGELTGEALAAGGALIKTMHDGIASRPFGILGPAAAPVRVTHDAVSRGVYAGVRGALRSAARGGATLAARRATEEGPPLGSTPRGSFAAGALNGVYGSHLHDRGNGLAVELGLRRHGADVPATPQALDDAYPDATSRLVVFVHGLCGDEQCWRLFPLRGRHGRPSYGRRLQDELSYTPLYVRYNTGRHISDNGRALARLLDDVVQSWPVGIEEIVLIGHSMGGLVVRSACHHGELDSHRWTDAVRHVFCLGSPHLGADLEKGANAVSYAFSRLPETRALAMFLNARSTGIKDLRYGACTEEDWRDCDPDEFLRDRCRETPFLPTATYYFIGATLSDGPIGSLRGDLLGRRPSAAGRGNGKGRRIPFDVDNGYELSGLTHFDLLNHPAVYQQLRGWLTRTPARRLLSEGRVLART